MNLYSKIIIKIPGYVVSYGYYYFINTQMHDTKKFPQFTPYNPQGDVLLTAILG